MSFRISVRESQAGSRAASFGAFVGWRTVTESRTLRRNEAGQKIEKSSFSIEQIDLGRSSSSGSFGLPTPTAPETLPAGLDLKNEAYYLLGDLHA
jgi:hypothetical protein